VSMELVAADARKTEERPVADMQEAEEDARLWKESEEQTSSESKTAEEEVTRLEKEGEGLTSAAAKKPIEEAEDLISAEAKKSADEEDTRTKNKAEEMTASGAKTGKDEAARLKMEVEGNAAVEAKFAEAKGQAEEEEEARLMKGTEVKAPSEAKMPNEEAARLRKEVEELKAIETKKSIEEAASAMKEVGSRLKEEGKEEGAPEANKAKEETARMQKEADEKETPEGQNADLAVSTLKQEFHEEVAAETKTAVQEAALLNKADVERPKIGIDVEANVDASNGKVGAETNESEKVTFEAVSTTQQVVPVTSPTSSISKVVVEVIVDCEDDMTNKIVQSQVDFECCGCICI
jgi:hypothetical protein